MVFQLSTLSLELPQSFSLLYKVLSFKSFAIVSLKSNQNLHQASAKSCGQMFRSIAIVQVWDQECLTTGSP